MKFKNVLKAIFRDFDYITFPILVVVGGWFLLFYFPHPFIPDLLNLKEYGKIHELFSLIINSLVSLIGIYITVSLVAYEFFKQKSGIDFQKSFLVNRRNAYFISFSVLTILCSFSSSLLVSHSDPTYREITIVYFNAILFCGVIIALFPIAFNLFSSLRAERFASEEISKLNRETVYINALEDSSIDEQTESFENDSLFKIETIVIALIAVKDVIKARAIIQKTTRKMANLIVDEDNGTHKSYITERLIAFHIRTIDFSLSQPNNSTILKSIWFIVCDMYEILIDRNESVHHFDLFHKRFFDRYFNRLIQTNNEEIIFEGIKALGIIIQNQVVRNVDKDLKSYYLDQLRKSIDPDYEIPEDYSQEDYKKAQHFEGVSIDLVDCLFNVVSKAIATNQPNIINKCFESIQELSSNFERKGVGLDIQCYFYLRNSKKITSYAYSAFKKDVFIEGHDAKHLVPVLFERMVEKKHPVSRDVLQSYCYLLIDLQKIDKLDRWFLGGLKIGDFITYQGELGHIAKRCAIKYKSGIEIQNCLEDCVNTFEILKEYYELNPPENLGLYLTIKTQFDDILYWLRKEKLYRTKVYRKVKALSGSFKEEKELISE